MFDEVLGSTAGLAEQPGVTATLKIRYRHVTPTDEELRFEGWIHEQRGRRLVVRATCHAGDTLTAQAEGIFIRPKTSIFEAALAQQSERQSEP